MTPNDYALLEAQTCEAIDGKPTGAGWVIQDKKRFNLYQSLGMAVPLMDTDIWPLECVMFMRDVTEAKRRKYLMKPKGVLKCKSQAYYKQMKSRGELHKVTPNASSKSRFLLVDCVGVTETGKTETKSLETKPSISTAKLMEQVARGDRYSATLRALGNRMIRLRRQKTNECLEIVRMAA